MDLVTQAVLGAAIGHVGWRRTLGPSAVLAGAFFGILPDFDIIAGLGGQWSSMVHHRGISHALIFAPVVCGPIGYLFWRLSKRKGKWMSWSHLAFWAIWTHPLLDAFTTYGTQLALPFSNARFAWDGISIIDPIYTFPMIIGLILASIWRVHPRRAQRTVAIALTWSTLYLFIGLWQGHKAKAWGETQWRAQFSGQYSALRATPTFANILAWRIVAKDHKNHIHIKRHSNLAPKPMGFQTIALPTQPDGSIDPLIQKARQDHRVKIFEWFSDGYLSYTITKNKTGTRLRIGDQRYGGMQDPTKAMWGVDVDFDSDNKIKSVERYRDRPKDIGGELKALKTLIITGDTKVENEGAE